MAAGQWRVRYFFFATSEVKKDFRVHVFENNTELHSEIHSLALRYYVPCCAKISLKVDPALTEGVLTVGFYDEKHVKCKYHELVRMTSEEHSIDKLFTYQDCFETDLKVSNGIFSFSLHKQWRCDCPLQVYLSTDKGSVGPLKFYIERPR